VVLAGQRFLFLWCHHLVASKRFKIYREPNLKDIARLGARHPTNGSIWPTNDRWPGTAATGARRQHPPPPVAGASTNARRRQRSHSRRQRSPQPPPTASTNARRRRRPHSRRQHPPPAFAAVASTRARQHPPPAPPHTSNARKQSANIASPIQPL